MVIHGRPGVPGLPVLYTRFSVYAQAGCIRWGYEVGGCGFDLADDKCLCKGDAAIVEF